MGRGQHSFPSSFAKDRHEDNRSDSQRLAPCSEVAHSWICLDVIDDGCLASLEHIAKIGSDALSGVGALGHACFPQKTATHAQIFGQPAGHQPDTFVLAGDLREGEIQMIDEF